ncbi:hypothetical protein [Acidovorax sp. SRB_14]|uniref:hypothetical protein n=1 Tax=Acidovorax sp. SRB_14 TaxID=1962699 RepID=UPI001567C0AF|nr:hypothetical protein [Acidovorax sp. SRB_14]
MNYVNGFLHHLSDFSLILRNEDLQGLLRYTAGITTLLISTITFYLKLKEKHEQAHAQLAVSSNSRDSRTRFPLYPLQTKLKLAPFPFMAPHLETRMKCPNGWFTITELRVWNAGQKPFWGSAFNPMVKVQITIEEGIGDYALRGCISNDASARVHLGRVIHAASGQQRLPIYFDILHPGKGILVQIWHNSQYGSQIGINAISDQISCALVGFRHPINPRLVKWMNAMTYWLILPAASLTILFIISNNTKDAVISGVFTWMLILSAFMSSKLKPLAPMDLGFSNDKAKIIFYHGP